MNINQVPSTKWKELQAMKANERRNTCAHNCGDNPASETHLEWAQLNEPTNWGLTSWRKAVKDFVLGT